MTTETKQDWYKPRAIAEQGLILDSNGNKSYRHVISLIRAGKLKARVWAKQDKGDGTKKEYFMVSAQEIHRYNTQLLKEV